MNEYNQIETDSQIQKANQWLPVGTGVDGEASQVKGLQVQTTRYKINWIQGCDTQHREYNHYFIIYGKYNLQKYQVIMLHTRN